MKYSIIIPHYNSPELLEKLLKSIPQKDEIEVIVIDDKSEYEKKYLDLKTKNPNVLFLENDTLKKGAGVCRNIGLSVAKGKWLLFADADDYFNDDFFEEIEKWYDSESCVVFFKSNSIEIGTDKESHRHIMLNKLVDDFLMKKNKVTENNLRTKFVVPWAKMVKKELVEKHDIKFSETLVANDVIFSTKVGIYAESISASNKSVYCVTRGKGSLSTLITEEKLNTRYDVFVENYLFLKQMLPLKEFKKLEITSHNFLLQAILNKIGVRYFMKIIIISMKYRIPIVKKRMVNPFFLVNKIYEKIKMNNQEKNFYVR